MTKTTTGIIIVVLLVVAGWWFSNDTAVAPIINETTDATATPDVSANPQPAVEPEIIQIAGNEFSYVPATISAKVGQTVTVTYTNTGKYPHNLVIDELAFTSKTIKAGETETFSFVPDKAGTFSFYCSLPNHRERGMSGTLSVN